MHLPARLWPRQVGGSDLGSRRFHRFSHPTESWLAEESPPPASSFSTQRGPAIACTRVPSFATTLKWSARRSTDGMGLLAQRVSFSALSRSEVLHVHPRISSPTAARPRVPGNRRPRSGASPSQTRGVCHPVDSARGIDNRHTQHPDCFFPPRASNASSLSDGHAHFRRCRRIGHISPLTLQRRVCAG